jgi:hypothetical protein
VHNLALDLRWARSNFVAIPCLCLSISKYAQNARTHGLWQCSQYEANKMRWLALKCRDDPAGMKSVESLGQGTGRCGPPLGKDLFAPGLAGLLQLPPRTSAKRTALLIQTFEHEFVGSHGQQGK